MVRVIELTARSLQLAMRFLVPQILNLLLVVGHLLFKALLVWVAGVRRAVTNMATEYIQRAHAAGVPSEYEEILYYASLVITVVELLAGWLVASHLTVWLFWLVF